MSIYELMDRLGMRAKGFARHVWRVRDGTAQRIVDGALPLTVDRAQQLIDYARARGVIVDRIDEMVQTRTGQKMAAARDERIRALLAQGLGSGSIAVRLNREGVPCDRRDVEHIRLGYVKAQDLESECWLTEV